MEILQADLSSGLRITGRGTYTDSLRALLGSAPIQGNIEPEEGNLFTGWEGSVLVSSAITVSVNLLTGIAAGVLGSPDLQFMRGENVEGETIAVAASIRALRIQSIDALDAAAAQPLVTLTDGKIIPIPQCGEITLGSATPGKNLPATYHTLVLSAADAVTTWLKLTVLGEFEE